jgi:hypothetical protein
MLSDLPFIKVTQRDGATLREFSTEAFLALPLHDRIAAIISGTLTFLAADDVVVDQAEALRAISSRQRKPTEQLVVQRSRSNSS